MALKVDYVAKEAAINLRRNLTLTFATVITVAIALTLVGASLLMRQGVARSNVKFHGDIQAIVYMNPTASADQIKAVDSAISASPSAMSPRRREIEVMKLVGDTNWFSRIPFMAEGLVQGIVGSAIGIGIVAALRTWMLPTLVDGGGIWTDFHVTVGDVQTT